MRTSAVISVIFYSIGRTEATEYHIGDLNTNECPEGFRAIDSEQGCKDAATANGKSYQRIDDWSTHPKGCLELSEKYYFNIHAEGGTSATSKPICFKDAATLSLTFGFGEVNTDGCPAGLVSIQDEAACRDAAFNMGLKYSRKDSWHIAPKGCIQSKVGDSKDDLFWNIHATGATSATYRPVCIEPFFVDEHKLPVCPSGLVAVSSAIKCQGAAAALGLTYNSEITQANFPSGCFKYSDNEVYFNAQPETGALHGSATSVCQPAFFEKEEGQGSCNTKAGQKQIASEGMCRAAAGGLGYSFESTESSSTRPQGCHKTGGKVYFNEDTSSPSGPAAGSAVLCSAAFTTGDTSTVDCSGVDDHSDIYSEAQCIYAAWVVGASWGQANSFASYPSGCSLLESGNQVNLNTAFSSSAHAGARPVCMTKLEPPTTTAEPVVLLINGAADVAVVRVIFTVVCLLTLQMGF